MSNRRPPAQPEPAEPAAPLWLLSPERVREQLLVIAAGSKQLALPAGVIEGVGERGRIHPVPNAAPVFLGAVVFRGALVPLLSTDRLDPRPRPRPRAEAGLEFALLDPDLLAGTLLLVVRQEGQLLAMGFERFVGFRAPEDLADPPGGEMAKWVKACGTIDEIPAFVVDTTKLFDYCRGRSR